MARDRPLVEARDMRLLVLYHHSLDPIYRYCARRLPTTEDAEDATSLIFTKTLAALPQKRDAVPSCRKKGRI